MSPVRKGRWRCTMTRTPSSDKSLSVNQSLRVTRYYVWVEEHPSHLQDYRVRFDDGRVWRRHVDNVLQNSPGTKPAESGAQSFETATPADPDPQPVTPTEVNSYQPDKSALREVILASTDPVPVGHPVLQNDWGPGPLKTHSRRCEFELVMNLNLIEFRWNLAEIWILAPVVAIDSLSVFEHGWFVYFLDH